MDIQVLSEKNIDALRMRAQKLESKLKEANVEIEALKARENASHESYTSGKTKNQHSSIDQSDDPRFPLSYAEYERYGRQLIISEVGLQGQLRLKSSSVLIIGAGGLGCPAAAYLAGAGVSTIGIVDGDAVDMSNLHRQILHSTDKVGTSKVDSAIAFLKRLNPTIHYNAYPDFLTPKNALNIFSSYSLILDCTDRPSSRYLISDTCVILQKPLISASALRTEGQLMVLNNPALPQGSSIGGPCYRCIFPRPPPPDSVLSCSEGGILGPVVGVMGVLQALEALKLIIGKASPTNATPPHQPLLHLFSAFDTPPFRSVRLRGRKKDCVACSSAASISIESMKSGSLDYVQMCGLSEPVDILTSEERITAAAYQARRSAEHSLLIDVREKTHFELCNLTGSVNVPYSEIVEWKSMDDVRAFLRELNISTPLHVICRLGNDSQLAVRKFKELGLDEGGKRFVDDIKGGWQAWKREVDADWPDI